MADRPHAVSDDFARLGECPDAEVDIARAALAIARDEYPQLDPQQWLCRLDDAADAARAAAGAGADERAMLAAIDHQLFQVEGFTGNAQDYYDPRNSYLNEVLERRTGIPITLSVVYLEVGWRLGLALEPLGFPGHFLVGLVSSGPRIVIDPFHGGRRLNDDALVARLVPMVGAGQARSVLPRVLVAVSRREVVARMLRNLKGIHVQREDWPRALRVADRLVAVSPGDAAAIRDRGWLYDRLGARLQAVGDYARYLELAPQARDAGAVRGRLAQLASTAPRLN